MKERVCQLFAVCQREFGNLTLRVKAALEIWYQNKKQCIATWSLSFSSIPKSFFFFRKNVLKVQVFYEELNVELITEERSYEVSIAVTFLDGCQTDRVTHLISLLQTRESQI